MNLNFAEVRQVQVGKSVVMVKRGVLFPSHSL